MSLWATTIPIVVSAGALAVAVWTHRRQHRLQERMVALEDAREKDRIVAMGKALLTAHVVSEVIAHRRTGSALRHFLRIDNKGPAEARDIKVLLDGKPIMEHPAVVQRQEEVLQIGPKSHFDYLLALSLQANAPRQAEMSWSDDSGEPGSYRTTLTL